MSLRLKWSLGAALALAALALVFELGPRTSRPAAPATPPVADAEYSREVEPVLTRRCVACHSCYNAPCQLNLASFTGLDRGANKLQIYHPSRTFAMKPTRLFQDAQSTAQWQQRFDFFPVFARDGRPQSSLLYSLVDQRRTDSNDGDFTAEQSNVCPRNQAELEQRLHSHPEAGMPYGLPPLDAKELSALGRWLSHGAPPPLPFSPPAAAAQRQIDGWEAFFNGTDPKTRLSARYLYEHLFLAHLHFEGGGREFFRLVRSRTKAPAPVDEIATTRPFDDPGTAHFYYRLRRIEEVIVQKTHIAYALSDAKLARLHALFVDAPWAEQVPPFPSYEPEIAANPFVAFKDIPPRARYQFMLDDAYYHVRAFIHGPVCKGQAALNVIDEHFWIMFLDPGSDPSITQPRFLAETAPFLRVPAEGEDGVEAIYTRFKASQVRYLHKRSELYSALKIPGRKLEDLWVGKGGALLTVYRHFDSAEVLHGGVGGVPKTAWVMDYPIFERIYYDLVAGFNVFGNVVHQLSTRRYMDDLRIEAEDGFLRFLPRAERRAQRAQWYRGEGIGEYMRLVDPYFDDQIETRVEYTRPGFAKEELLGKRLEHRFPADSPLVPEVPGPLSELVNLAEPFAQAFPDLSFLRIADSDEVYSIVRNKAHLNVSFVFLESEYRVPAEDTLHVVRGFAGSYPNLFFVVPRGELASFVEAVRAVRPGDQSFAALVARHGVSRRSARFWPIIDGLNDTFMHEVPIDSGWLDLSRYAP
jgi:Fatty acid cis/trans isomerase (CTI)